MNYLYVGIGGFIGAVLRYVISIPFMNEQMNFPFVTLIINVTGSFLLTYMTFYLFEKYAVSKQIKLALTTGLLGSFTTFSSLSVEVVTLLASNQYLATILYLMASLIGGIFMAYLGYLCHKKVVFK